MFDRKFSDADLQKFIDKCASLPPIENLNLLNDYVESLLYSVLDFQMRGATVRRAMTYFRQHAKAQVADYAGLRKLFDAHPDTQAGNLEIAQYLFGYKLWTRVELLRRLLAYFEARDVTTQAQLKAWAEKADFVRDFKGQVKGAGFAIFQWLVQLQGVDTVVPDMWIHRFIQETLGFSVSDETAVELLETAALELGIKAYDLDWRIWAYQNPRG